jgi:hypothetical protein
MPWRLSYNPSLSGERGRYPLCARYQCNLDIGFFIAQFSTPHHPKHHPRGPPKNPHWRTLKQTFQMPFTLRPHIYEP